VNRPATVRLFLALWPEPTTRAAIAEWQRSWQWPPEAALVAPERLHLTLHFLGNVPAQQLPQLAAGLQVGFEALALPLERSEVWPHGVAVLRPEHTPTALKRLHAALGDALTGLGLPAEDRPFRAHVTLARRASGAVPPASGPGLCWEARQGFVLVRSLPAGAGYEVLERFG
jgi:RNA 2',3'-cyclic 3'-phosphodiesterase